MASERRPVLWLDQPVSQFEEVLDEAEQECLDKLFADGDQLDEYFLKHQSRLLDEHLGEYALVYQDQQGEPQIAVGSPQALSKHEAYGQPAATVKWLGFELYG